MSKQNKFDTSCVRTPNFLIVFRTHQIYTNLRIGCWMVEGQLPPFAP